MNTETPDQPNSVGDDRLEPTAAPDDPAVNAAAIAEALAHDDVSPEDAVGS